MDGWDPDHGVPGSCRDEPVPKHSLAVTPEVLEPVGKVKNRFFFVADVPTGLD